MPKYISFLIISLFVAQIAYGQDTVLHHFNKYRLETNTRAMLTLGGWAVTNIAVNAPLCLNAGDEHQKYFYQMNVAWNFINLAIAGFGYYDSATEKSDLSLNEAIQAQSNIENILLFNAGLDIGYIMTGMYLLERSKNADKHKKRLKGYGQSIIVQGGFLFLFDVIVYYFQHQNWHTLQTILTQFKVSSNGVQYHVYF